MPFELESFAQNHFAGESHQSFVAAVQQTLDPAILLDVLSSSNGQLQETAARRLEDLSIDHDIQPLLRSGLTQQKSRHAMLAAMSYLSLSYDQTTRELISELLDHDDPSVAEAAARAIIFQIPGLIDSELIPRLESSHGKRFARQLCFSRRVDLIPHLAERLGFPDRRLPPVIGFLISPEWLAENHNNDRSLVENLAEECGYLEGVSVEVAREYWSHGLMYLGPKMTSCALTAAQLKKRVLELCFRLLPLDVQMEHRQEFEFDGNNNLDLELLLSALREADRTNLQMARKRSPFDYRRRTVPRIVTCSHASVRYVRHQFIESARHLAEELEVPPRFWGTFLIEHGRVGLEVDDERQTEADLYLRSRWHVISQNSRFSEQLPTISFPVNEIDDFPWGAETWLGRSIVPIKRDPDVTAGANAMIRIASTLGLSELAEWIREKESDWRGRVPPIGCEVQIPLGDRNTSLLRKQVLRRLGVPSPRRPEYRAMVEAAFRPSASWHAMLVAPMLLVELGIIDRPQEMALHISIQGDAGSDIRYLATCATFIRAARQRRPAWALTRVMSKGLVCRNVDVEECVPGMGPGCRTEIRLHRCYAVRHEDGKVSVEPDYADDILATHLLLTAAMSQQAELRRIYSEFCKTVAGAIETLPPEFGEYLHADFYQATGDPHDPQLLELVPVVSKYRAVRAIVRRDGLREELEQTFLSIRDRAAWNVLRQLTGSESAAAREWNRERSPHAAVWPVQP